MTAPEIADGAGGRKGDKRDAKFEGIRGYLALGVLVFHVSFYARIGSFLDDHPAGIWTVLADGLFVALPPFFVLSGYFLYRPFARSIIAGTPRPAAGRFLWGRVLRLLPAYYLLLAFALLSFNPKAIVGVWDVLRPILLIHFYWPPNSEWIVGIEPTWTVPAEMLFYLSLPLLTILAAWFARRGVDLAQRARRSLVSTALMALVGFAWTVYILLPSEFMTVASHNLWYWPFAYYDAFAIGMLLATLAAYAEVSKSTPSFYRFVLRWPHACWLGALAAFLLSLPKPFGDVGVGDTAAMIQTHVLNVLLHVFALLVIAPLTVPGVRSRFMEVVLANHPMRYLGRLSYGVYLWHVPVLYLVMGQGNIFGNIPEVGPPLRETQPYGFFELLVYTVAGSLAIATISYFLLEQPILRLRNRGPRVTPPTEPAAATIESRQIERDERGERSSASI